MKKSILYPIAVLITFFLLIFTTNHYDTKVIKSSEQTKNNLDSQIEIQEENQISKKEAISLLKPQLEKSIKKAISSSINPDTFLGLPATCFAPDTDKSVIDDFYKNRTAVANSLGLPSQNRFNLGGRWGTTALDGGGLAQGDFTTLTWSYVADGTPIGNGGCAVPDIGGNSDFIAFFNGIYGGPTTPGDFTTAPWHNVFVSMFDSWSAASGLQFVYEPNDDGATVVTGGPGVSGVRGDFRVSGHPVDGNNNVLACNYFPENGDMIIDTADNFYVNNPGIGTTNVLTHEIGHGLGIAHVCPVEQTKLMEPFVTVAFNGPQEDDILATNRHYGDPEGTNNTAGNASFLGATSNPVSYSKIQRSIDDNSDIDYFSFTISEATVLSASLIPTGTTYLDGVQNNNGSCSAGTNFNALTVSDLRIEILGSNGSSVIAVGDSNGAGISENLAGVALPIAGTYFVRVRQQGTSVNNVQMYDLNVSLEAGDVDDNDVAVTAIISPDEQETGLTNAEQIDITLSNLGAISQSNIPYEVTVDGVVVATETYAPSIPSGTSVNITVPTTVDLSAIDTYEICAKTVLTNDENTTNDEVCKTVVHSNDYCVPTTITGCNVDGIKQFVLGTINVDDGGAGCNTDAGAPQGYSDRTSLSTNLDRRTGMNVYTLQASTRWNNERIKVWIDFNNNGDFTDSGELVLDQLFTITDGTLEDFSITIPSGTPLVTTVLRARAFDPAEETTTVGPCDDIVYGETQDYTVTIIDPDAVCLGVTKTWDGSWSPAGAPDATDEVIIEAAFSGNLEACTLNITNNAILTVPAGNYIRVQGDITVDAGASLLVAHQGSVVQVEDDSVTINNGTINVTASTLPLKPRDFTAMGSPMSGVTREGDLGPLNRVMEHVTANFMAYPGIVGFNFLDDNFDNHIPHTGVLNPGEGYFVRPRPINATGNEVYEEIFTTGTLNSGDVSFSVGYNGSQGDSYNLLANPYASAIDARLFINDPANSMVNEIYLWEHTVEGGIGASFPGANTYNHSMENISMFNLTGPVTAATAVQPNNGYLSTSQGFGILATAAGTATFTNAMRLTDNNNTLRAVESQMDRVWLKISNTTYDYHNTTLIGFTDQATNNLDAGYDSGRMATVVGLYSHLDDGSEQLAIQGRSGFDVEAQVKLGFATIIDEEQTYTISLEALEGPSITNENVYLVDKALGTITNLSESDYIFTSNKAEVNDRFIVQFTDRSVLATNALAIEAIAVYPNPTDGIINIVSPQASITGITVTDIRGRVIRNYSEDDVSLVIDLGAQQTGMYFVNIQTEFGNKIERVIKK